MMNSVANLPIALRAESFGGILFDPADATFLELDHEGFELLWDYADNPAGVRSGEELRLLGEVREQLRALDGRPFRRIPRQSPAADGGLPVLSAPSLVDFQITDQCHLDCPHCYADSTSAGEHGRLQDILLGLEQVAEFGAFQVAIGGGEPLLHPQLDQILARCHQLGMVPNLTTSGLNLSNYNLNLIKRYCGAVGVSLEGVEDEFDAYRKSGFQRFRKVLARLAEWQIPTVLQVTLNTDTFARLDSIVDFCRRQDNLYGVIFLAFKPVGRGAVFGRPLAGIDPVRLHEGLQSAFFALSQTTRVGFDCCMTPGVTGTGSEFDAHAARYLEGCSALRASIGLLPNLDVLPCTFTAGHAVGNLHCSHIRDIWHGMQTRAFRDNMVSGAQDNASCSACSKYSYCLGGCPVMDLVNCNNDHLAHRSGQVAAVPVTVLQ